jgi:uncharacterized protein
MISTRHQVLDPRVAVAIVVGALAAVNVLRSTVVPSEWHLVLGLASATGALALGIAAGLDAAGLGLTRSSIGPGLRTGAIAFVAVAVVVGVLGLAGILVDDTVDVSTGDMLLRSLVVIPVGTVFVEEVVFRGVLHGLLADIASETSALFLAAGLFGLWHVFPAWVDGATTGSVEVGRTAAVAATLAATTAAGAAFGWLRVRSGSLIAPTLAHVATNSLTFAVAWAAA